jgi:hypothetical protein
MSTGAWCAVREWGRAGGELIMGPRRVGHKFNTSRIPTFIRPGGRAVWRLASPASPNSPWPAGRAGALAGGRAADARSAEPLWHTKLFEELKVEVGTPLDAESWRRRLWPRPEAWQMKDLVCHAHPTVANKGDATEGGVGWSDGRYA